MAQRTSITYVSDLSGDTIETSEPTVRFGLDGKQYLIDLTDKEQADMREALAGYLQVAKTAGGKAKAPSTTAKRQPGDAAAVREWAGQHGFTVPGRGRLPQEVKDAYDAAH